ncbi:MAG: hypothetical protein K6L76_06415 [Agarilytica sp.]
MKKILPITLATSLISSLTFAQATPVTNQFSSGQPARASEVNANFQELADRIETNATDINTNTSNITTNTSSISSNAGSISANTGTINTHTSDITANSVDIGNNTSDIAGNTTDIATNSSAIDANSSDITALENSVATLEANTQIVTSSINEELASRTFLDVNNDSGTCDQRSDSFSFNTTAQTFEQTVIFENNSDGTDCTEYVFTWDYSNDIVATMYQVNTSGGVPIDYLYTHDEPWLYLKATMKIGESWASFSERNLSINGGAASPTTQEYHRTTLLGRKDISVPAGEFEDCLMLEDVRIFTGLAEDRRLYYVCEGPGLARWVSLTNDQDWQLQSYTEN